MLKISHSVTHPGRTPGDEPVDINVPEELGTVPGVVQSPVDVDYWSREYPLENLFINNNAEITMPSGIGHGRSTIRRP